MNKLISYPHRLPFEQHKPYIPPKARGFRALTIAVSLQCKEGFVLCADQQMSHGSVADPAPFSHYETKVHGTHHAKFSAALCGAGAGNLIRPFAESFFTHLTHVHTEGTDVELSPWEEEEQARDYALGRIPSWEKEIWLLLEGQLEKLTQTIGLIPDLGILAAVVGNEGRYQYLRSEGRLVYKAKPVEILGVGETSLVYYLRDSLYRENLTLRQTAALGVFIVAAAKKYCPQDCGGPTDVHLLCLADHSWSSVNQDQTAYMEQLFWEQSPQHLHRVLNHAASTIT